MSICFPYDFQVLLQLIFQFKQDYGFNSFNNAATNSLPFPMGLHLMFVTKSIAGSTKFRLQHRCIVTEPETFVYRGFVITKILLKHPTDSLLELEPDWNSILTCLSSFQLIPNLHQHVIYRMIERCVQVVHFE